MIFVIDDKDTGEKKIEIGVICESLHILSTLAFGIMLGSAMLVTHINGGYPNDNLIHRNFGSNNICLYFDYKPVIYFVPPMFLVVVTTYVFYASVLIKRAFLAWKEEKISKATRVFFNVCVFWRGFADILFILCFAVQPVDAQTLVLHTGPFTNLILGHFFYQVSTIG